MSAHRRFSEDAPFTVKDCLDALHHLIDAKHGMAMRAASYSERLGYAKEWLGLLQALELVEAIDTGPDPSSKGREKHESYR